LPHSIKSSGNSLDLNITVLKAVLCKN